MINEITLKEIQNNPDLILDNIDWLKTTLENSGEIYKNFVETISQNPNEFKVSRYVEIMNFDDQLGDVMGEGIMKEFNKIQAIIQALQNSDFDKVITIMYHKTEDEIKNMSDEEKTQFIDKSMIDFLAISGKFQQLEKLMGINELNAAYQKELYSEDSIDKLLSSNIPLKDKKLFLSTKIESIKQTLKGLDILVEELQDVNNTGQNFLIQVLKEGELPIQKTTESLDLLTTSMDKMDVVHSKIINSNLELLKLLIDKRKLLEE